MSDLIERAKHMPSSLNDACRTIELMSEEIKRLREQLASARADAIEECAKLIEQTQETIHEGRTGSERYLAPRKAGNLMGIAYASGVRALTDETGN